MRRPTRHLTDGDLVADHHNAAPPDLLSGITALLGGNRESARAHDTATARLAPCAGLVTHAGSAAAGNRAAQR